MTDQGPAFVMRLLALFTVGALGGALVLSALEASLTEEAQAQTDSAASIIAAQIRKQGFTCEKPNGADRDAVTSRPDTPVWILECGNATYRVELVPKTAAKVEKLD
jgi:hypothetical protein